MLTYAPRPNPKSSCHLPSCFSWSSGWGCFAGREPASAQFHLQGLRRPAPSSRRPTPSRPRRPCSMDAQTGRSPLRPQSRRASPARQHDQADDRAHRLRKARRHERQRHRHRRRPGRAEQHPASFPAKRFRSTRSSTPCSSNRPTIRRARSGASVAGSTEAFVDMMNQRALAMGCFNTHFDNPNGLPAPAGTHYTSCADLMRIFRAVIKYPELRRDLQHQGIRRSDRVRDAHPAQS